MLGHSDGVCHLFLDEHFDSDKALPIILDAKLNYPAACNALETLLVHAVYSTGTEEDGKSEEACPTPLHRLLSDLQAGGVEVLVGPSLHAWLARHSWQAL
ncbi:MAG: hypothetical protein AAFY15_15050, partial [Cyanobacteria bacterium J06648_11]